MKSLCNTERALYLLVSVCQQKQRSPKLHLKVVPMSARCLHLYDMYVHTCALAPVLRAAGGTCNTGTRKLPNHVLA